jgi:hypothetical protein
MRSVIHEMKGSPVIKAAFNFALHRAYANIETTIIPLKNGPKRFNNRIIMNPLLEMPEQFKCKRLAVIYLNPLFTRKKLGRELTECLTDAGYDIHAVSEGLAGRLKGWVPYDKRLADKIAYADIVISAPGMGVLSQVMAYNKRYIALCSKQPEQQRNIKQIGLAKNIKAIDVDAGEHSWRQQILNAIVALKKIPDLNFDPYEIACNNRTLWRELFLEILDDNLYERI